MRLGTKGIAALAAVLVACASSGPITFGEYRDLAPKVALPQGERVPRHLTVQLAHPANVAVFLIVPGGATRLLFPEDSMTPQYVEAGSHLVETAMSKSTSDSSKLIRLPNDQGSRPTNTGRNGRNSGYPRDSFPTSFGFGEHGYLLIYASQQPLSYSILSTRVAGLSVPIDGSDALNTVTKLIRERTRTTGPWAAFATNYPP